MQLYALNHLEQVISSMQAAKQQDYKCIECLQVVRLRGGIYRQNHFYHSNPNQACRLSQKSEEHIQVQLFLQKILPEGECFLEKRFNSINRIADAVWEPQKLIFEVQCSSISYQEVLARNSDYEKEGYKVIWILHDQRYNKWRVTAAEMALTDLPHYFTNIDETGQGIIYDRYAYVKDGLRKKILKPLIINIKQVSSSSEKITFEGDLTYCRMNEKNSEEYKEYVAEIRKIEEEFKENRTNSVIRFVQTFIIRPYRLIFQMLLEAACK